MYRDIRSSATTPNRIRFRGYPLPDPVASYEQWLRFQNADVDEMSAAERHAEFEAARRALAELVRSGERRVIHHGLERIPAARWLLDRANATRAVRR
jgi:hypothetical protein